MTDEEVEIACEIMHGAYELAAVKAGWETQTRSRVPWSEVPEANKATMREAVKAVAPYIQGLNSPLYANEQTMFKVYDALDNIPNLAMSETDIQNAILGMQNRGIYFREARP